jgi:hypothetical protein
MGAARYQEPEMIGKTNWIGKAVLLFIVVASLAGASPAAAQSAGDWTWTDGSSTIGTTCYSSSYPCGQLGVYGTKGTLASANFPGSRTDAMSWTDTTGRKWLFGGFGYGAAAGALGEMNDLWQSNAAGNAWEWVSGSSGPGYPGTYGTMGTAAALNIPGGRQDSVTWTDSIGNLWVFGGLGYDGSGTSTGYGYENDLWMYNPTTNQWTWEAGSSTVPPYTTNQYSGTTFGAPSGVYGTMGTPATGNTPGGRTNAMAWTDASGNLWMFGGGYSNFNGISTNYTLYNDLWEFNTSAKQWIWQGGSNTSNASGVYGTQGTGSTSNIPGARYQSGSWKDPSGNVWLFSGTGYDAHGIVGSLNDLWQFNPTSGKWTWEFGSSSVGECYSIVLGLYTCPFPGSYGTQGTAGGSNVPGSRNLFVTWTDTSGNLWLFGGSGADANSNAGWLNDLWKFNPGTPNSVTSTNGEWTWVGGSSTIPTCTLGTAGGACGAPGVYGTEGTAASGNIPGAREAAVSWTDQSGNFWLFGGWGEDSNAAKGYLNDMWEYQPSAVSSTPTAATPTFSVAGGSYSSAQTVTLSDSTSGATIYYTTNGTTPTTSSSVYSTAISVSSTETLEAIAVATGYSNSTVATAAYTITQPTAAAPTFSVAGGSYGSAQTVTLSDSTSGATIYYTTNGTTPTTSSSVYSAAINVSATETLEAIAVATGYSNSAVATSAYTITQPSAATPTFSVAGGTYSTSQTVTLSDSTSGATIYYTTNGTTPTTSSSVYSTAINVSATETLEAIAVASGYTNSAVATAAYTVTTQAPTPTFSVAGGTYSSAQTVTLSDGISGATIYYTTNGTTPTTSSAVYSTAINVSATETLEAIAVASGYTNSAVATAAYTITTQAATPTFSVAGGSYSSAQTVTLSDSTSGAIIYYTTNGTTPTTSSAVYSTAINVSATETLEAIAVAPGHSNSTVATVAYTITQPTAATPTFSVAGGTYSTAQTVTLSDSTSGATIYYTTNGTTPTTSSSVYSIAISVSSTETLEAIAVATGYTNSAVATAAYTITQPIAATPAFSVVGGSYSSAQTVTLSDTTTGATIYYTTNGTTPTTSSSVYSGAINVSATETLEAIAVASGYTNSAVATAAYTITILSPSFTITSPGPIQSVTAGSAATYTISVTPQNGAFTSPITFSVNGLPSGATATFNPATVTPGSTATNTTLTINTPAMALLRGLLGLPFATRPITLAFLILLFLPGKQHRRKIWLGLMLMVSFGAATILTGCGGGFESPGSGLATYNITVTAAGGSVQQVTTLQLTVKE